MNKFFKYTGYKSEIIKTILAFVVFIIFDGFIIDLNDIVNIVILIGYFSWRERLYSESKKK